MVLLYLLVVTIPLAVVVRARDKARRTVVAFYQVEDMPAQKFQALADSFGVLRECSAHWYVLAQGRVRTTQQYKTAPAPPVSCGGSAGKPISGPAGPGHEIAVPSLHGRVTVYFLPDRIWYATENGMPTCLTRPAGLPPALPGSSKRAPCRRMRSGSARRGYVNKGRGPDRRYKSNRQLPILNTAS